MMKGSTCAFAAGVASAVEQVTKTGETSVWWAGHIACVELKTPARTGEREANVSGHDGAIEQHPSRPG